MRPRLLELPDAPLLATAAAVLVLLYTLWRVFVLSGDGWKKVVPTVVGGLLVAGILIKVVAFGEGFQKSGVPIFSYGFMIMLGFAGVIWISATRGRLFGLDPNHIMDLGLFAMLGGIVGARIWHFLQYRDQYENVFQIVQIWRGGIVFYGGLIGGFICCTAYILKHKLNYWVVSEVCGPAIPIGIAFARLGCFLNGCCFGGVCDAGTFAAVHFPANFVAGESTTRSPAFAHHWDALQHQIDNLIGQPGMEAQVGALQAQLRALEASGFSHWVHPAQLYASLGTALIAATLLLYSRFLARKPGESFFLLLVLYAPFRFWMETFRDDTPANWGGMTAGQATGIPLILLGVAGLLWVRLGKPPHMEGFVMRDGVAVAGESAPPAATSAPPPAPPTDEPKPSEPTA